MVLLLAFGLAGFAGLGSGLGRSSLTPAEQMMWSTYAVGAHAYLIHTDVYPGDSDGPVFDARTARSRLLWMRRG